VLRDINLSIRKGEFVAIVGYSGAGKTTLLSMIAGLMRPDTGSMTLNDLEIVAPGPDRGVVFQNYSLLPWLTALENVRLAVGAARPDLPAAGQRALAARALEQVGLGAAMGKRPRQLSGGMRQRVALARAFATEPGVLFLDEPFGALDAMTRETLQQDLASLGSAGRGMTTLMITNSVEEAILLSDRIVPMLPGPPATLGAPIVVGLPRPRSLAQLAHDEGATMVRAHVVSTLTAALARPGRPAVERAAPAASLTEAEDRT
jgi:nitrate/nitrite transport system ATP-binding protein